MRGKSLGQLFISIGIIIAAYLIGNSFIQRNSENNTIWVKGLGKQNFTSDLIVWRGSFTTVDNNLQNAYSKLDSDRALIKEFLSKYNIGDSEIVFNSVNINKDFTYSYDQKGTSTRTFNGYVLRQEVKIESKKVEETEKIAREVTELINKGVEFYSEPPQYFYTQLASLKQEMIANATTDARLRAEQIAENANSKLGALKNARMGVFQIVAQNSNENFSWGGSYNTNSKKKTATITMTLEYKVD